MDLGTRTLSHTYKKASLLFVMNSIISPVDRLFSVGNYQMSTLYSCPTEGFSSVGVYHTDGHISSSTRLFVMSLLLSLLAVKKGLCHYGKKKSVTSCGSYY